MNLSQKYTDCYLEGFYQNNFLIKRNKTLYLISFEFDIKWSFQLLDMITHIIIRKDAIIYFIDNNSVFVDPKNGTIINKFKRYYINQFLYVDVENLHVIRSESLPKLQLNFSNDEYLCTEENIFSYDKKTINAYSRNFGAHLWKLNVVDLLENENVKIYSNLIHLEGKLFFYCANIILNKIKSSFCLNINSGKILKQLPTFTGSIKESDGLLYTSHEKSLQILDPETYQMNEINLIPELTKYGFKRIDYEKWFVEDNKFYFAQNIGDNISKIGVFDLKTESIIDKVDFAKENGTIGSLQKNGNRLYVHTQDKTLHVFELDHVAS